MPEVKEPRIKLFGKTIELPEICHLSREAYPTSKDGRSSANQEAPESEKIMGGQSEVMMPGEDGSRFLSVASESEDQAETDVSPEGSFKKPEPILPCPRCDSRDTKFCYFNNYNTNQPRHFCKSCQRYWTAGGTMRNVPFGAGRRKIKHSGVQLRRVTIPGGLQMGADHPNHSPACESAVSSLDIDDEKVENSPTNGFHRIREIGSLGYSASKEDDPSSESSIPSTRGEVIGRKGLQEQMPSCLPQIPCFPGSVWPYQWHLVPWSSPPSPSAFAYGSFPLQVYSAAPWTSPLIIPPVPCPSTYSPTLGKHPRDVNSQRERVKPVPKSLKTDGSLDAAKIYEHRVDYSAGGISNLFRSFQSQSKDKKEAPENETSTVLKANPAALSRSIRFHENS